MLIVEDPRAARPYLYSDGQNMYNRVVLVCTVNVYIPPDGQNMYNRVVLVCTVNVYIPPNLGQRPILRYLRGCLDSTIGQTAYKIY
jgi:hypothetical protein